MWTSSDLAQPNGVRRVTGALADATGRSDDEMRFVLTLTMAATSLLAVLRFLRFLADLGIRIFGSSGR